MSSSTPTTIETSSAPSTSSGNTKHTTVASVINGIIAKLSAMDSQWIVAGVSLLVVAVVVSLIALGFCLGRRYCCKAPSVILNAGSPLPFWHRAWNTMGVYRPCSGHRCATSHCCSRTVHHC